MLKKKPKKNAKSKHTTTTKQRGKLQAAELTLIVSDRERASWTATANTLPEPAATASVPFAVLLGEGIDAAKFARAHWEPVVDPKTQAITIPGLSSAVRPDLAVTAFSAVPVLHDGTAREILVLHALTQEAQTYSLLAAKSSGDLPHPRVAGASLLSDLRGAAESFLDDGVETDEDARLRAVRDAHANDPGTDDALAGALVDYGALVETLRPSIDTYADFKPAWIDRARALSAELRVAPVSAVGTSRANGDGLDLRNRLLTLLSRRIGLVRAKARFVFREHPALLRAATSEYERRRRVSNKRKKAAKQPADPKTPA